MASLRLTQRRIDEILAQAEEVCFVKEARLLVDLNPVRMADRQDLVDKQQALLHSYFPQRFAGAKRQIESYADYQRAAQQFRSVFATYNARYGFLFKGERR